MEPWIKAHIHSSSLLINGHIIALRIDAFYETFEHNALRTTQKQDTVHNVGMLKFISVRKEGVWLPVYCWFLYHKQSSL
jgi:hypothetical protein